MRQRNIYFRQETYLFGLRNTLLNRQKVSLEILTSGSSGKMLSTSLLYRGLSAPQQPQTPEENKRWGGRKGERNGQVDLQN